MDSAHFLIVKGDSGRLYDVCVLLQSSLNIPSSAQCNLFSMPQWPRAIKEDVLFNKRAEYGKQVLKNLSKRLNERYGKGWGYKTLQHCVRAAYTFSESDLEQKVIDQVEEFMHEMGDDFSLIERIYVAGHTNT